MILFLDEVGYFSSAQLFLDLDELGAIESSGYGEEAGLGNSIWM